MRTVINTARTGGKIMLIGVDARQILEKRFRLAGCQVVKVSDNQSALSQARQELFDLAVLVSKGSLTNAAETIFNLRDIRASMEIIVLVERLAKSNRFLRQLLHHPIEGTYILTRRQLQKHLHEQEPVVSSRKPR